MSESTPKPITPAAAFAWMLPRLTETARKCGYALGLHGSMTRDLDLIAVPWTDDALSAEDLVGAIRLSVDGTIVPDGTRGGRWNAARSEFVEAIVRMPEPKPHGRLAWNIHLWGNRLNIDLSVMPRVVRDGGT